MKNKGGLGVLLLAGLLSAVAIWFLPANSAAADILLLITNGAVTRKTTQTEAYEIKSYGKLPTLKTVSLEETNTPLVSDFITDFEENNLTLSVVQTHYPVTPDNDLFTTKSPDSSGTIADVTSAVQTHTGNITGTELSNHTHFYPSLYLMDKQTVTPNITIDVEETDKKVCDSVPNHAEVLAIVIGVVFVTALVGALFYQLAVFIKNKRVHREHSIFIIENVLHKNDVEANGPETKF